jgi:hypothetical protein
MTTEELDQLLAQLEVPETRYRADMELHDRSQVFSSELLKLALAGIAVVGFFLANIPDEYRKRVFEHAVMGWLLIGCVVGFAGSVGCALWHRFLAGGANFHHLQYIKLLMIKASNPDPLVESTLRHDWKLRGVKFHQCHRFLVGSAVLLFISASLLGAAFVNFLVTQ